MLVYVWVPGFYAEVERRDRPELRDRPVVVGGNPRKGGKVQSATADARSDGVREGMPVIEALERSPHARALLTDMKRYRDVANQLQACFRRETLRLEPAGLGAAWLDVSDEPDPVETVTERLQQRVRDDLGLPLRAGSAPLKFVAKVAAEMGEGDTNLHIPSARLPEFLAELSVERLPGAGPRMVERLRELGVRCGRELRALGRQRLEEEFGNHGRNVLAFAEGRDVTSIRVSPHRRSVSQETTLEEAALDRGLLGERVAELARGLEAGLALEQLAARKLVLKVRYADQEETTRSRTLRQPVAEAAVLARLADELLGRTQAGQRPIRGLGLSASSLVRGRRDDRQLDLFSAS